MTRRAVDELIVKLQGAVTGWAAVTGVMAAAVVLGVAELIALFVGAAGSPLFAVGSLVIDLAPAGVKKFMIDSFGTGDKAALFVLMAALIVLVAAAAGVLEFRRPRFGMIVLSAGAVVAVLAVLTRAGASGVSAIPTLIGGALGVIFLRLAIFRLARWNPPAARMQAAGSQTVATGGIEYSPADRRLERRHFLTFALVAGATSVVLGTGARVINATSQRISTIRGLLNLPAPAVAAPALPPGATIELAGLSPFTTPNADFYRIDTALQVPTIDPNNWQLLITGLVENEITISFAELLTRPLEEHRVTLTCVSNSVGGDLIGTALWLGYPISELLAEAKPLPAADMVLSRSVDGFTAGTPLSVLEDLGTHALLAVGMNGQSLPPEHGFPVRMVVPGLYGYVSATKWVVELKVTKFSADEGYWTPRGWDALGPVKLASRIDVPKLGATVASGMVAIAGVAWEQHVGVKSVEVRVDGGPWSLATLADSVSPDTWRQWIYRWPAKKGGHSIEVRATDANGVTQGERQISPAPNGAEGWHRIQVMVA